MDLHQIEAIHESAAGQRLAQRQPLPGSVYEIVTDMLMTHAFEPGARLNIEELARALGVSPTPVREALARVEADGLIVKQPGRSYTVAPLMGIEQVRELIELRLLVEPALAAKAAGQAGPNEIKELRRAARAGEVGGKITAAANRLDMVYDATFHAMVADLAGNQMISDMLTRLRSHLHTFRLYYQRGPSLGHKERAPRGGRSDRQARPGWRRGSDARPPGVSAGAARDLCRRWERERRSQADPEGHRWERQGVTIPDSSFAKSLFQWLATDVVQPWCGCRPR